MASSKLVLSLVVALLLCENSIAKKWRDNTGEHSLEGELSGVLVVIQLEDGGSRKIPLDKLSVEDRQFVLESLKRDISKAKSDQGGIASKGTTTAPARDAVPTNKPEEQGKAEIDAAQLAVLHSLLNDFLDSRGSGGDFYSRLANLLPLLLGQEREAVKLAKLLMSTEEKMSERWQNLKLEHLAGFTMQNNPQHVDAFGDIVRILAEIASVDAGVKEHFQDVINELQTSPEPKKRIQSAFRLYRAEGVSDLALPVLRSTLEGDASIEVRLTAAVALGGYKKQMGEILPLLLREFSRANKEEHLHILAGAICELEPKSPVVRKFVKECFDVDARLSYSYYDPKWLLGFLSAHNEQGVFATRELLEAAERRAVKGDFSRSIAETLINVAPTDPRVLKFYQKWAKKGPQDNRIHYDTTAKRLQAIKKKREAE